MKILFDENVPYDLKKFFGIDFVITVQEIGWGNYKGARLD